MNHAPHKKLPRKKALGRRGSWFATVDDKALPCIHRHWLTGLRYRDPGYYDSKQWRELHEAVANGGEAILTNDKPLGKDGRTQEGLAMKRTGYIAVWKVANVTVSGEIFELDLVEKLYELE
ncbi:hypothetical protein ACJ4V0_11835 [Phreatobacter sp. HK31-P]